MSWLSLQKKEGNHRTGCLGTKHPFSETHFLDAALLKAGYFHGRPSTLRSHKDIDRQNILVDVAQMSALGCFRVEHIGWSILRDAEFPLQECDRRYVVSVTLLCCFACYLSESLYFVCVHDELLTPVRPEKDKLVYSDLHPLLEYVLDFLVLVREGLIEPDECLLVSYALVG